MPAKSAKIEIKIDIQVCTFLYRLLPAAVGKLCIPLVYTCCATFLCHFYTHKDMHILELLPASCGVKKIQPSIYIITYKNVQCRYTHNIKYILLLVVYFCLLPPSLPFCK